MKEKKNDMVAGTIHPAGYNDLHGLDATYSLVATDLSVEERVELCEKMIDRAQQKLAKNNRLLSDDQKEQLMELITSARQEIIRLQRGEI